jgi:DNA phosphorothioation system restriction enzyme
MVNLVSNSPKILSSLPLQVEYSSDNVGLVSEFYTPCLSSATLYRRAVGYFTSHGLVCAAQGIASLLNNGGKIQLVASPMLNEDDMEMINRGYQDRDDLIRLATVRSFMDIEGRIVKSRLDALAWMISTGLMEVNLAIRVTSEGKLSQGQYHEKIGIISDIEGNHVAFSGSPNETSGGLIDNYESIDVYWSWDDPHNRVQRKISKFERMWANKAPGLSVINFTEASQELLEKYKQTTRPKRDPEVGKKINKESTDYGSGPRLPSGIEIRKYQKKAINGWLKANGHGVFKMATGTGKTITALAAALRLFDKNMLQGLIIVCPYQHLVTQWEEECKHFNIDTVTCFQSRVNWEPQLNISLYNVQAGLNQYAACIVTNATFISDGFQNKLQNFPVNTLMIADEVHNMGATTARTKLPENIQLRIGLSATPERWFDDIGTQAIFDYFGDICIELGLKEALDAGALCKYRYYPILVELTEGEQDEYLSLSAKISRLMSKAHSIEDEDSPLTALLIKRARLVASAENKLFELRRLMESRRNINKTLFYCGDGRVDSHTSDEDSRQIEAVRKLLGKDLGIRVASYTADTPVQDRKKRLQELDRGDLQGLVAIKCLDEGVDIPSIETAVILASSTNPRQFIQRRGRILRNYSGKHDAAIYDMIVVPPDAACAMPSERTLMEKELRRFVEFADLAKNPGEARDVVWKLQKNLGMTDI